MENKIKGKVLKGIRGKLEDGNFIKFEDAMNFKRIVEDFDEYIHSKEVYKELISMKCTQYSVVDIIREVWEECKSID